MNETHCDNEAQLAAINAELAELLDTPPADLARGGGTALHDPLWIWGVVGGKDVGKSTLINALAGAPVVTCGVGAGEGTAHPAAYFFGDDEAALRARFSLMDAQAVTYHPDAPAGMAGLVLVDLPDFDSTFTDHVEQVRQAAQVLDGIIWVTTPKKVSDLRAIREIHGVLKSRTNFVYVVNKMDWVLAQSAGSADGIVQRTQEALSAQIAACDPNPQSARSYLLAARYRDVDEVTSAVMHAWGESQAVQDGESVNGDLAGAARRLVENLGDLRTTLTTPPSAQDNRAGKQANLDFQLRRQAQQLLGHHRPLPVLENLDAVLSEEYQEQIAARSVGAHYGDAVLARLHDRRALLGEWSAALFKRRISYWPMVGLIAWPVMLLGNLIGRARSRLQGNLASAADPYRVDGIDLESRVEAALAALAARASTALHRLNVELPNARALAEQFRADISVAADHQRRLVLDPLLSREPSVIGRMVRALLPIAVVLWFPFVQPLLVAVRPVLAGEGWTIRSILFAVAGGLSATSVLMGLLVVLIILAGIAAAVYSRAVRQTYAALDRLDQTVTSQGGKALVAALCRQMTAPLEQVRSRLAAGIDSLQRMMSYGGDVHAATRD